MKKSFSIIDTSNYYYLLGFTAFLVLFFSFVFSGLRVFVYDLSFLKQPYTHTIQIEFQPKIFERHMAEEAEIHNYIQNCDPILHIQKSVITPKDKALEIEYKISAHHKFSNEQFKDYINQHSQLNFIGINEIPSLYKHLPTLLCVGSLLLLALLMLKLIFMARTTALNNQKIIETLKYMGAPKQFIVKEFQSYFFCTYLKGVLLGTCLFIGFFILNNKSFISLAFCWDMRFELFLNAIAIPIFIFMLGSVLSMTVFYSLFYRVK